MNKPLVIYHANCTDGFGAAFVAWTKLGDEAEYLPMQYEQTKLHEALPFNPHNRDVYIFDFSFERQIMDFIFRDARRVVWLDHHKTAFEMWCGSHSDQHHEGARGDDRYILLHSRKSGALLAWEYFHPGTEVPMLIQHIDDRDRWQFKLEGSKELHAALASYKPWSFKQWKMFLTTCNARGIDYYWDTFIKEGAAILRAQDAAVAQAVKHARMCKITITEYDTSGVWHDRRYSFEGLAVSCPLHQSEIGHELANKSGTFGLVWYMKEDGSIVCSLRSNGDYDVSAIAKAFGGGGHKNAAGFQTDVETLMEWLK